MFLVAAGCLLQRHCLGRSGSECPDVRRSIFFCSDVFVLRTVGPILCYSPCCSGHVLQTLQCKLSSLVVLVFFFQDSISADLLVFAPKKLEHKGLCKTVKGAVYIIPVHCHSTSSLTGHPAQAPLLQSGLSSTYTCTKRWIWSLSQRACFCRWAKPARLSEVNPYCCMDTPAWMQPWLCHRTRNLAAPCTASSREKHSNYLGGNHSLQVKLNSFWFNLRQLGTVFKLK